MEQLNQKISGLELRKKYIEFFKSKGHVHIPSAPLIPENDATVLFTTAGMHPLVPYLLGQPHPSGKRIVDFQKCVRTDDIEEVGDTTHHTFFEMLGNWSLGDYFKKEAINWSYEFLSEVLKIDMNRLYITCFEGDKDAPKDEESANIWVSLGIPKERITFLGKKDNWWGPAGQTGPCGPDTEMHYDTTQTPCGPDCKPGCSCGRFNEIWNDVFMEYNKNSDGKFEKLEKPNVDTGMGLERTTAVLNGLNDNYLTDLWTPIISSIEKVSGKNYEDNKKQMRVIADHLRASVFIISDGVTPSNKERGYILRRLIRRAAMQLRNLGTVPLESFSEIVEKIVTTMSPYYPETTLELPLQVIGQEIEKFQSTLEKGLKEFNKLQSLEGKAAFDLFQTYGFPWELTIELAKEKGFKVNKEDFEFEFKKHQELSRTSSKGMFKGGLQDNSEVTTKYHTTTHLLHKALRDILGTEVQQKGSNITAERLRFDFSFGRKMTEEEIKKVENLVNEKISEKLPVNFTELPKEEAEKTGALHFFGEKYGDTIRVYYIGGSLENAYSKEYCGGPHITNTSELGNFKIIKEEAVSAGIRRIKAILE